MNIVRNDYKHKRMEDKSWPLVLLPHCKGDMLTPQLVDWWCEQAACTPAKEIAEFVKTRVYI